MTEIDETQTERPARRSWDWSFNSWGNRLVYSVLAGFVINLVTGVNALGTTIAVILFVLTSAIVTVRRR